MSLREFQANHGLQCDLSHKLDTSKNVTCTTLTVHMQTKLRKTHLKTNP